LKERELWDDPEQEGSATYWKTLRKEKRAGKKSKGNTVGNWRPLIY
jgi:hypothetical protein